MPNGKKHSPARLGEETRKIGLERQSILRTRKKRKKSPKKNAPAELSAEHRKCGRGTHRKVAGEEDRGGIWFLLKRRRGIGEEFPGEKKEALETGKTGSTLEEGVRRGKRAKPSRKRRCGVDVRGRLNSLES